MFEKRYTREELAKMLKLSVRTLEKWKERSYGPPFYRMGKSVYYPHDELMTWLEQKKAQRSGDPSV